MIALLYFGAALALAAAGGGKGHPKDGDEFPIKAGGYVARDLDINDQDQGVHDNFEMTVEDYPDIEADDLTRSLNNHEKVHALYKND